MKGELGRRCGSNNPTSIPSPSLPCLHLQQRLAKPNTWLVSLGAQGGHMTVIFLWLMIHKQKPAEGHLAEFFFPEENI